MTAYIVAILLQIGIYSLMTLSLNIQYGFTGLINFGLVAFYCIGAYTTGILAIAGYSPLVCALAAIGISMLAALPVGFLTLRLRGDFLAILTLGLSETIRLVAINERWLTNGSEGIAGIPRFADSPDPYVLLAALGAINIAVFFIFYRLVHSPFGRTIRAIRDDEDALKTVGKDPLSYRLRVLMIGCGVIGIAGYFQAYNIGYISPEQFYPDVTFLVWMALIVGGVGSVWGALAGAFILFGVLEGSRFLRDLNFNISEVDIASARLAFVGLVLVLLIMFRPQGLLGKRR